MLSKEQQGLEPRKPTKTTSFYHSIYCDSRGGGQNLTWRFQSGQPSQHGTEQTHKWDSDGNGFLKCHASTSFSVFDYLLLPSAGRLERSGTSTPKSTVQKRLGPPLPGYSRPVPISSRSPTSTHPDSQPPTQPHGQKREEWFCLTPPCRTLNTHFPFTIPQTPAPTTAQT